MGDPGHMKAMLGLLGTLWFSFLCLGLLLLKHVRAVMEGRVATTRRQDSEPGTCQRLRMYAKAFVHGGLWPMVQCTFVIVRRGTQDWGT